MASKKIKSATGYADFEDFEGDAVDMDLTWKDDAGLVYDLTQYTACLQVRSKAGDTAALLDLNESNGITLSNVSPNVLVEITKAQNFTLGAGSYVYDLELTPPNGKTNTLLSGKYVLKESVTKC